MWLHDPGIILEAHWTPSCSAQPLGSVRELVEHFALTDSDICRIQGNQEGVEAAKEGRGEQPEGGRRAGARAEWWSWRKPAK